MSQLGHKYVFSWYKDEDHYQIRLFKESDQKDFETGKLIWDSPLRGWLTKEEFDLLKPAILSLGNVTDSQEEPPPQIVSGLGSV
jgi:hypothetical protein